MKINRVSQKDHPKISWKNSFFMNIYYFFCFYVTTQSSLCLINSPLVKSMDSSSYR